MRLNDDDIDLAGTVEGEFSELLSNRDLSVPRGALQPVGFSTSELPVVGQAMLDPFCQNIDSVSKVTRGPATADLTISEVSADGSGVDQLGLRTMLADLGMR